MSLSEQTQSVSNPLDKQPTDFANELGKRLDSNSKANGVGKNT